MKTYPCVVEAEPNRKSSRTHHFLPLFFLSTTVHFAGEGGRHVCRGGEGRVFLQHEDPRGAEGGGFGRDNRQHGGGHAESHGGQGRRGEGANSYHNVRKKQLPGTWYRNSSGCGLPDYTSPARSLVDYSR